MARKQSTGVPTNTVFKATTAKQRSDQLKRYKANNQIAARNRRLSNTIYGALTYKCSNPECFNKIREHEEIGDRKILCSKCNSGFFTVLVKDDRKQLARPEDMKQKKKRSK
ncbi:hypothetical protein [Paenibacillus aceti]|uniref:hypothetical protein n=1 Tax=Paenibacillus aceti TaxID=1820010 RepID=UPI000EA3358A|nr:hypothetical protein [Paenibacillus aceti]